MSKREYRVLGLGFRGLGFRVQGPRFTYMVECRVSIFYIRNYYDDLGKYSP